MPKIEDLFTVVKGKGGYIRDLDLGTTPLVSATNLDNGIRNFVTDVPKFEAPAITVERVTGSAFVQLIDFSTVPDDLSILIPKNQMELWQLYIVASVINNSRWRFSYARKLTPTRLRHLILPDLTSKSFQLNSLVGLLKLKADEKPVIKSPSKLRRFKITELFLLVRGDFHSLSRLESGDIATVSRVSYDSGIAGYYAQPPDAKLYPPLTITISTVTGDAFVQLQSFIATDNVLILLPKAPFLATTLFFIQTMLNKEKWRCTYGRQLYKAKFRKTEIVLPITDKGQLDEDYMKSAIRNAPYWNLIESYIKSLPSLDTETTSQLETTFGTAA